MQKSEKKNKRIEFSWRVVKGLYWNKRRFKKRADNLKNEDPEIDIGTGVFAGRKFDLGGSSGETKLMKLTRVIKKTVNRPSRRVKPREETKLFDKIKNFIKKDAQARLESSDF